MDGQLMGRTDHLIIEHRSLELEILIFLRNSKSEHSGAGFRFEGEFEYQTHRGEKPTSFVLKRSLPGTTKTNESNIKSEQNELYALDPIDIEDARERTIKSIFLRRGQSTFRKKLLNAYNRRCAVTGCSVEAILEAAHIHPYKGGKTNSISNGVLLRADIHTLFDLNLIRINPNNLQLSIADCLLRTEYAELQSKSLNVPAERKYRPSTLALSWRYESLEKL